MYIIINNTANTCTKHTGHFPNLDIELDRGDKIIILSFNSNTIKVPHQIEEYGIVTWDWEEFPLDKKGLRNYKKQLTQ